MDINFSSLLDTLVDRFGNRDALINIERDRRYTFRQLHQLSNQIANMLHQKLNLGKGDRYLSILENDNLSLLHLWTSLKAAPISVWTNYRDSLSEHCRQMDLTKPKVVFIESSLIPVYATALQERGITIVSMDPPSRTYSDIYYFWELLEGVSDASPSVYHDDRQDVVLLRFTGGTTGKGKCAQYTLDNWMHSSDAYSLTDDQNFTRDTRYLHISPISHGSGIQIFPVFLHGGCNITMNTPDLEKWCQYVQQERVNTSMMVPTLLYRLLHRQEARGLAKNEPISSDNSTNDLTTLSRMFYGAAPMAPDKLKQLQQQLGNIFVQVYAATENLAAVSYLDLESHSDIRSIRLASCGRITPGVEVRIVNAAGQQVAPDEVGEIWVRSRSTINGYYQNPEATAAEFHDGFWKSGDLARMDAAGYLYIVDRCKDMIISGGFNIYAAEVEASINSHPAVTMSAVIGIPHPDWGEIVHAEVILKEWCNSDKEEIAAHVKQTLGNYKAPKSINFVQELPMSSVGKVLRREVKQRCLSK